MRIWVSEHLSLYCVLYNIKCGRYCCLRQLGPMIMGTRMRAVTAAGWLPKQHGRTVADVSLFGGRPCRSVCPRMPPQKARLLSTHRATSRTTPRLRAPRQNRDGIFPLRGSILTKELRFRALLIRGLRAGPPRV